MCKVGGPRCPKAAGEALKKALDTYKDNPTAANRNEYHKRLYQYQLTKRGFDTLKAELNRQIERNQDKKTIEILQARVDRIGWHRAHLTDRKKCEKFCNEYIESMKTRFPNAENVWNSLIEEGDPKPRPSRAMVKNWLNGHELTDMQVLAFSGPQHYALKNLFRRCKYEQIVDSVDAVEMAPAGSQADQYPRDPSGRISEVYYASYGSNMNKARFMTYIEGGKVPGSKRTYHGCKDNTPPQDDIPIKFDHPIFYAMNSTVWDGGMAFLDHSKEGKSLGRAYLISSGQFDDVISQESGFQAKGHHVDLEEAVANRVVPDYNRNYGTLVHVGDYNGRPVMTFTSPYNIEDAMYADRSFPSRVKAGKTIKFRGNSPSGSYMRMIGSGLEETFNLSKNKQADYFLGSYGGNMLTKATVKKGINHVPEEKPEPAKTTTKTSTTKSKYQQQALFSFGKD